MDNKIDEYKDNIDSIEALSGMDLQVKPDFYIHLALLKAQKCLTHEDVSSGFLQFRLIVEHLEILCNSAKLINEETYKTGIDEYKKEDQYINAESDLIQTTLLANKKLGLLTKEIFSNKTITDPLKT